MRFSHSAVAALSLVLSAGAISARAQTVAIHGEDITIRGCVTPSAATHHTVPPLIVWSRSDIMLAGATAVGVGAPPVTAPDGVAGRVFYWLDDKGKIAKHVGQRVEVKGELDKFKQGEIEIKRGHDFTDITLDLGGAKEKARIPTSWLGPSARGEDDDKEQFDIVSRKIEVKDVRVLGACAAE